MKTLKSITAILAGMITIVVLSVVTDKLLETLGIFPSEGLFETKLLVLAFIYRSVYAVLGGYVTALLAPKKPIKHAIILGLIGTLLSTLGAIAGWDLSSHWYPIALAITALPLTWLGAKLRK